MSPSEARGAVASGPVLATEPTIPQRRLYWWKEATIIAAFYAVYNVLGYGFLEKVYAKAMLIELHARGVLAQDQAPIVVHYHGQSVGEYFADLLVANTVIVELKAAKDLAPEHEAQLLNYLKATACEVGLLLNPSATLRTSFGPEPQIKRKVYDNKRKGGTMGHR